MCKERKKEEKKDVDQTKTGAFYSFLTTYDNLLLSAAAYAAEGSFRISEGSDPTLDGSVKDILSSRSPSTVAVS